MPSLSRRTERDGRDNDHDDLVDERGERHDSDDTERLTDSQARHRLAEQDAYDRRLTDRDEVVAEQEPADGDVVVKEPMRRPRTSGLATLSLILGLFGALAVLTGVLAPLGVAAGVLGLLFGIGGMAATNRRHVSGRFDVTLGLLLSIATIIVGGLAMADQLSWLSTETNQVTRFHDWLVTQMPWLDRF